MTDKRIKKINWINTVLTAVALILECLPWSVKYALRSDYGDIIKYWSYFGNPLNGLFLITVIIAVLTVLSLIFNIVVLLKDKKSIKIFSAVLSFLAFAGSVLLLAVIKEYATAYNVIIAILFFVEFALQGIKLRGNLKAENKLGKL